MPDAWQTTARGGVVHLDEIHLVAGELITAAGLRNIWLFYGEMGSGKTTLIKAIGRILGVMETMSSPTFSIINEYLASDGKKVFHFDLYRLKNEREVFDIGIEEYFDSQELCLVEWPEKLGTMTPSHHFKVRITPSDGDHRKIDFRQV